MRKSFFLYALMLLLLFSGCTSTEETTEILETEEEPTQAVGQSTDLMTDSIYQKVCVEGEFMKGPWENNLALAWIDSAGRTDGDYTTVVEAGGVPTVIQDADGRLIAAFQWFPCENEEEFDKVAVSISEDEGETWSDPELIEIEDFPEGYQRPFDPTLALLEDGRIRMYYTSNANGMSTFSADTKIYSAISEDGIHYTFEEGSRFALEEYPVYDSAVGYWDGLWHLITPKNNETPHGAYHATSEDGLTFERQDDIVLSEDVNWTGNFLTKEDGLYFYGTPVEQKGNWWTMTDDGETWSDATFLTTHGGDPAVVCVEKDRCLMITVQMANQTTAPLN